MNAQEVMQAMAEELGEVSAANLARATARLLTEAERQGVEVTRVNMESLFLTVSLRLKSAVDQTEAVVADYQDIIDRRQRGESVSIEELNSMVQRAYSASSAAMALACGDA